MGSCRVDHPVTGNKVCKADVGTVAANPATLESDDQKLIIEIDCDGSNVYGRYVYILPNSPATKLGFCEARVFGNESKTNRAFNTYLLMLGTLNNSSRKGSRTGHSVKVSLWYASLLTNTRVRFLYFRISN